MGPIKSKRIEIFTYCQRNDLNKLCKCCYIVSNDNVLDISCVINIAHPGGPNVLFKAISTLENQYKNISMHRPHAIKNINKFIVGKVKMCNKCCLFCENLNKLNNLNNLKN